MAKNEKIYALCLLAIVSPSHIAFSIGPNYYTYMEGVPFSRLKGNCAGSLLREKGKKTEYYKKYHCPLKFLL